MYGFVLALHSLFRWLVLLSLLFAIYRAWHGWRTGRKFTPFDNKVRVTTATIAHLQLVFGIWLYCISPLITLFLQHFKETMHQRQIRFFGMEHSTMMLLAIVVLTIGSAKAKRKPGDKAKFKTMAIWFTIALLIILSSIPWAFSPMVSRPWFRWF